ncbi:hypothetical protein T190611E02C_10830 [Tenacibaculum sp. 190524A05c]
MYNLTLTDKKKIDYYLELVCLISYKLINLCNINNTSFKIKSPSLDLLMGFLLFN